MRRNALARAVHHKRSLKQVWQLGDVARYASRLIKSQRLGDCSIALVGMAVDICPFESTTLKPASSSSTVHGGGRGGTNDKASPQRN